ncbi:MAG: DUF4392 domain-containing protein [Rheinheimera sp.]|nr:MAG: DUF4392 domain-containing protein [Rheinheimera sp.]
MSKATPFAPAALSKNGSLPLAHQQVEALLVARNPRGMALARQALQPGYLARAAALLYQPDQTVLIGTGFPVAGTFETDGPVGAIAIYRMLQSLGVKPVLVCGEPLLSVLTGHFQVEAFTLGEDGQQRARQLLSQYQPAAVLCIERPGQAADGRYYNMRHEDISAKVADLDALMRLATCPTVGIGDGGNEIGMGKIIDTLRALDIRPAVTGCSELIVADVSNWAAYGLAFHWSLQSGMDLFHCCDALPSLQFLSEHGSVDGVTRQNTLTEDGLPPDIGASLCQQIYQLYQQHRSVSV